MPATNPASADVLLLGCVKSKLDQPAPAEELFVSPLFRARREHAERRGLPWFILSSRHGLVRPDEVIGPYDLPLAAQPIAYRRLWAAGVADQLKAELGDLTGMRFEIHAGAAHAEPVAAALHACGAEVRTPLRGLSQGQHLAWYRDRKH